MATYIHVQCIYIPTIYHRCFCVILCIFQVAVTKRSTVPSFTPELKHTSVFAHSKTLQQFLLTKMINGERASYHAPRFLKLTVSQIHVHVWVSAYVCVCVCVCVCNRIFCRQVAGYRMCIDDHRVYSLMMKGGRGSWPNKSVKITLIGVRSTMCVCLSRLCVCVCVSMLVQVFHTPWEFHVADYAISCQWINAW